MSFNGSGTFLINTAGQPVVSGTVISSTAFNALTADLATGLSTAITKDGQTTVTANIPMSTYKFTGLGVGSAATDSANLSQVQSTVTKLLNSVSGADTITATASPTLAAYAAGQMFYFVAAGDNTTSVTLNIDALGAKAVTRDGSTALVAADIKSGEVIVVVYDGTRFQVVSQLNSAGDARFANVSIASSLYVGGVSTFVGNAGFSANVSIASALSVGGVAAITGATTIGGNLTLSGGTANGVLYLNGSKVATSGSALVFDGTNLGVGTASPSNKLVVNGSSGTTQIQLADSTATNNLILGVNASTVDIKGVNGFPMAFYTANAERMRLDSSGVLLVGNTANYGVGSAESNSVQVKGPIVLAANNTGSADNRNWVFQANAAAAGAFSLAYSSTNTGWPNAAYAMVVDKSGNLGLGVTPQTWTSYKALQINTGTTLASTANQMVLGSNWYFNSGDKYVTTDYSTIYIQNSGQHKWYNAPSGTAGNAISFTQAMTLNASGFLGVGATSQPSRITIEGTNGAVGSQIQLVGAGVLSGYIGPSGDGLNFGTDSGGLLFRTGVTGNGSVTTGTERARITSGGVFCVNLSGVTYSTEKFAVLAGNNQEAAAFKTDAGATTFTVAVCNTATSGDNKFVVFATESTDTTRGSITYNRAGGLVAYNVTSDYRAKDILGPVQNSGATIDALKVYEGQMKGATQSRPMLVAHEAQEHAPYTVTGEKDAVNEDGTPNYQQMDVSALVPLLLAEVQSLRKRVAELESK